MTVPRVLVYCGHQSRYGLAHLEPLLRAPLEIAGVVVADDRRWSRFREALLGTSPRTRPSSLSDRARGLWLSLVEGRRRRRQLRAVHALCSERAVPVWRIHDANDTEHLERVRRERVDWIISAAYPQIFGAGLLACPSRGSINFHPSLLPKFRGAHPHFWAVATGACETGVTAHLMTERLDEGDIVARVSFGIEDLTYAAVYDRIVAATPELVEQVAAYCRSEDMATTAQDPAEATYFRNDRDIHHRVFWDQLSAREIVNLVRTGVAYCFFQRERVHILEAAPDEAGGDLTNGVRVTPGAIVGFSPDGVAVKATDGCVRIRRLKYRRRSFRPDRWMEKFNVGIGECFS